MNRVHRGLVATRMPRVRIPITLAVAVAVTSSAFADDSDDVKRTKALVTAMSRGAGAVKPLVRFPLSIVGVNFATPDCTSKFPYDAKVAEPDLPALLACLTPLRLVRDGASLVGDPGYDVYPMFDAGLLVGLESSSNIREDRAAKNLAATANIAPDAAGRAAVATKAVPFLAVEIHVCVATDGTVESSAVNRINVPEAGAWSDAIIAKVKDARYKPFVLNGTKIRGCSHQTHVYPAAQRKTGLAQLEELSMPSGIEGGEVGGVEGGVIGGELGGLPPPPPPPLPASVPPRLLEANRIAGEKVIVPDDETKARIMESKKDKVIGAFKLCISATGAVASITTLKSTGYPAYDGRIDREMRKWKYTPYLVNGTPQPVCTAITFIYAQK